MSKDVIGSFFEHLEGSKELQRRLQSRVQEATARAVAAFAAEQGFKFTGEQFAQRMSEQVSELSEAELDAVAGGLAGGYGTQSPPAKAVLATAGMGVFTPLDRSGR